MFPYQCPTIVDDPGDSPPIAVIDTPVVDGYSVTLDSSNSYDPDGDTIDQWEWEIHGPGGLVASSALEVPVIDMTPHGPEDYDVFLRVHANGKWSTQQTDSFNIPDPYVDTNVPIDAGATAITVDNGGDRLSAASVFAADTTLREALNYVAQNGSAGTTYRIDLAVATIESLGNYDTATTSPLEFTSTVGGTTICGAELLFRDVPKIHMSLVRIYNGTSEDFSVSGGSSGNSNSCIRIVNAAVSGKYKFENCVFAMFQDGPVTTSNALLVVTQNCIHGYATTDIGNGGLYRSDGASTYVFANNLYHGITYRPQTSGSNAKVLAAYNYQGHYTSYEWLLSNIDGPIEVDFIGQRYRTAPSFGRTNNIRIHGTNVTYYMANNVEEGGWLDDTYRAIVDAPQTSVNSPTQINNWNPNLWRVTATGPAAESDILANLGTGPANRDDVEAAIIQDWIDSELYGTTPTDLGKAHSQYRWDYDTCALLADTESPPVFHWGNADIDPPSDDITIEIESVTDFNRNALTTGTVTIDIIGGDGNLAYTGTGSLPSGSLTGGSTGANPVSLKSGNLGSSLTFDYSQAVALAAATGSCRVRAKVAGSTNSSVATLRDNPLSTPVSNGGGFASMFSRWMGGGVA